MEVINAEASLSAVIHPTVLLNITDYYTRTKCATSGDRVVGALVGVQRGRLLEIHNSFETPLNNNAVDETFFQKRRDQIKQVYPSMEILGWYATGESVQTADKALHEWFTTVSDTTVFLRLDLNMKKAVTQLPAFLYESEVRQVGSTAQRVLIPVQFGIEASDSEGVAVSFLSKMTSSGGDVGSRLQMHLSSLFSSVKMLSLRLKDIVGFLAAVKKGDAKPSPALMRLIANSCQRLPTLDTPSFQKAHFAEYNDSLLLAYLAVITKGVHTLNEVVDRFNIAYDRQSRRRH